MLLFQTCNRGVKITALLAARFSLLGRMEFRNWSGRHGRCPVTFSVKTTGPQEQNGWSFWLKTDAPGYILQSHRHHRSTAIDVHLSEKLQASERRKIRPQAEPSGISPGDRRYCPARWDRSCRRSAVRRRELPSGCRTGKRERLEHATPEKATGSYRPSLPARNASAVPSSLWTGISSSNRERLRTCRTAGCGLSRTILAPRRSSALATVKSIRSPKEARKVTSDMSKSSGFACGTVWLV